MSVFQWGWCHGYKRIQVVKFLKQIFGVIKTFLKNFEFQDHINLFILNLVSIMVNSQRIHFQKNKIVFQTHVQMSAQDNTRGIRIRDNGFWWRSRYSPSTMYCHIFSTKGICKLYETANFFPFLINKAFLSILLSVISV